MEKKKQEDKKKKKTEAKKETVAGYSIEVSKLEDGEWDSLINKHTQSHVDPRPKEVKKEKPALVDVEEKVL